MSVLDTILEWSQDRPDWQRDALRRLVEAPDPTDNDVEELLAICKRSRGIPGEEVSSEPLMKKHCPAPEERVASVRLLGLSNPTNIDVLASDEPLDVAPEGLTVVYGANGMGKSGYVRVLKQMCRARGKARELRSNVFEASSDEPSSIEVQYQVGSEERALRWTEGEGAPDELRAITVFDEAAAAVYTDKRCDVEYLPFGLDLLPRLAALCGVLRGRLQEELSDLKGRPEELPEVPQGSQAADFLTRLDQVGAEKELASLDALSEEEKTRKGELQQMLGSESPASRAKSLNLRAKRLRDAAASFARSWAAVSPTRVAALKSAIERHAICLEAVELASEEAFADEPVPGVGSDAWQELWKSARTFSTTVAFPDRPFPPAETEPCPLCHQELAESAADRMARFRDFMEGETQRKAEEAGSQLQRLRDGVPEDDGELEAELVAELEGMEEGSREAFERWHSALLQRITAVRTAVKPQDLDGVPERPPEAPLSDLTGRAEILETQAATAEAAAGADGRANLKEELAELEGRAALFAARERLKREILRRRRVRRLEATLSDVNTAAITRKLTELTREVITDRLVAAFHGELEDLGLSRVPVGVAGSPGQRGTAFHEVRLEGTLGEPVRPGEVLSRGEHRCVALAACLAELATFEGSSTVVFDDPVSSLDHDRRGHVARRLVELSMERPILILTHDITFLYQLQAHVRRLDATISPLQLTRRKDRVGVVRADWPWEGMRVKKRIGALRGRLQEAEVVFRKGTELEYTERAKGIYGALREAWEKAVEEVLLNEAVLRFRLSVETNRLSNLGSLEPEHLRTMELAMGKCSQLLEGHAAPEVSGARFPEPDEIGEDIQELDDWRKELEKLHK